MTNETKPVLLTEAEAKSIAYGTNPYEIINTLRERGLIAPEPVDALLIEVREIVARVLADEGLAGLSAVTRRGDEDGSLRVSCALAALRRGMEIGRSDHCEALAKPELTREMVREAVIAALTAGDMIERDDFGKADGCADRGDAEAFIDRLHAAIQGQSK